MRYEYLNYSKYNIDNIYDAFENENRDDFFRICKLLKFTINPYSGKHKYQQEVKLLDSWLEERLSVEEKKKWKKILQESDYINTLYEDLYNEKQYIEANAIEAEKELSAFLIYIEYALRVMMAAMIGVDYLSDQFPIESKETIKDINDRTRVFSELFDNTCIKIKDILGYICFIKKRKNICEKVDIEDIEKASGYVSAMSKKTRIDLLVESWQFGDLEINHKENVYTFHNDFWGQVIRLYWEIRERSNTSAYVMARNNCLSEMRGEAEEIEMTKSILEKKLYVSDLNYECKIFKRNKMKAEINIFDLVKGYARLKLICCKHLMAHTNQNVVGDINEVCVRIEKGDMLKQLKVIGIKDATQILELLTYKKGRDIIDSPLIESGKWFYMIPTLVAFTNISEAVLSMANAFEFRGKELEKQLFTLLREEQIPCGKLKKRKDAGTYECDSLFVIENSLFLVEAKAWGFPNSITKYYYMNQKIMKADEQIKRLEKYVRENMSVVLETLKLPSDYRIDAVYRIILSNFQRADSQMLENTFLCDYNSFVRFVKDVPPGIVAFDGENIVEKIAYKEKRTSSITADEMIEFLQRNEVLEICSDLMAYEKFHEQINEFSVEGIELKRKVGLMVFEPK